jgi:hypothetical protein
VPNLLDDVHSLENAGSESLGIHNRKRSPQLDAGPGLGCRRGNWRGRSFGLVAKLEGAQY